MRIVTAPRPPSVHMQQNFEPSPPRRRIIIDEGGHPVIRVIAAVISRGDQVLICQRAPHKRHGGLWEFPGGKCEPGESLADAAQRELREELGVEVVAVGEEELTRRDPGSPYLINFAPVEIVGEPSCREHIDLRWVSLAEGLSLPLAPTDREYVEARLRDVRLTAVSR